MPPLDISRSQLDKLSKRLRNSETPSDGDLDALLEVLLGYQQALTETQVRLRSLGYSPTSRPKTTSVLIEKLKRERTSIKSVQDIAGARIVEDCDRDGQDEIVAAIIGEFSGRDCPVRVKDRRTEPSFGYRAVHVIVTVQGLPVEIQVRTLPQDMWAQITESLGDRWGRGIRYGEPPLDPATVTLGEFTRAELWDMVLGLSESIDAAEQIRVTINRIEQTAAEAAGRGVSTEQEVLEAFARSDELVDIKARRTEAEENLRARLHSFARWAATAPD